MLTRILGAALVAASVTAAMPALAQSSADEARFRAAQDRFGRELDLFRQEYDRYIQISRRNPGGYPPPPPRVDNGYNPNDGWRDENGYDPTRYYRGGAQYRERAMGADERVYSGNDGRYYCKRSDGTTGLVVGGALGGILGNVIDGGRSRIVGTLLGGAAGALAGKSIDQKNSSLRCQ
ncbi:glycine zipper 2TM domain-containing protein [uncultured Sphingomonas sp.]|uniref:glycine zipper 2TM domain-containing protein n=1 Tax=uncultured Sphingomonas sp. TaxID=158754 RepID=UPI002605E1A9|nr:glycine zipper 2TM domain-containing protein [uncultured Sphingomonas sp.]